MGNDWTLNEDGLWVNEDGERNVYEEDDPYPIIVHIIKNESEKTLCGKIRKNMLNTYDTVKPAEVCKECWK